MALDSLTTENRDFYERSLVKTMLAVVYFGFALFYLGMVAFGTTLSVYFPIATVIIGLILCFSWWAVTSCSNSEGQY